MSGMQLRRLGTRAPALLAAYALGLGCRVVACSCAANACGAAHKQAQSFGEPRSAFQPGTLRLMRSVAAAAAPSCSSSSSMMRLAQTSPSSSSSSSMPKFCVWLCSVPARQCKRAQCAVCFAGLSIFTAHCSSAAVHAAVSRSAGCCVGRAVSSGRSGNSAAELRQQLVSTAQG